MEKTETKPVKILNSGILFIWVALLLSIVITSAMSPIFMAVVVSILGNRVREMIFAGLIIFLATVFFTAFAWIRLWDMTKYLYQPETQTILAGENGTPSPGGNRQSGEGDCKKLGDHVGDDVALHSPSSYYEPTHPLLLHPMKGQAGWGIHR